MCLINYRLFRYFNAKNIGYFFGNYLVEVIDDSAFAMCTNLKTVILNEGLKKIGNYAFALTSIERIIIPSTVTQIGKRAFFAVRSSDNIYCRGEQQTIQGWDNDWSDKEMNHDKHDVIWGYQGK